MDYFALWNLVWVLVLSGVAWAALGFMDYRYGISFKEWWGNASSSDRAQFLSYRILGVCILIAFATRPPF